MIPTTCGVGSRRARRRGDGLRRGPGPPHVRVFAPQKSFDRIPAVMATLPPIHPAAMATPSPSTFVGAEAALIGCGRYGFDQRRGHHSRCAACQTPRSFFRSRASCRVLREASGPRQHPSAAKPATRNRYCTRVVARPIDRRTSASWLRLELRARPRKNAAAAGNWLLNGAQPWLTAVVCWLRLHTRGGRL
jgi:hypothetical protein